MSRYLITGGAGFIGSHLVDSLIEKGDEVIVLDDLSSGKESNVNASCKLIKGCITNEKLLSDILDQVDFCYHLAAIPSVQKSIDNWMECHEKNLTGTINVFNEAAKRQVPVIYASSAAIYGDSKILPISESSSIDPQSPYGVDKYCCELQAKLFSNIHGLKTIGFRFFNVYGTRQDPNSPYSGVISIFADKIKEGNSIKVFGDGSQERDFIFVGDVVKALISAENHVSVDSEVYNICTGKGYSINELIDILFTILQKSSMVNYLPPRDGDIYKSIGDSSKARTGIGVENNIELEKGIKVTFGER